MTSTATEVYGSRSISRQRRTSSEMDDIREAIFVVLKAENPMTVRQTYYQLVSRGDIEKTEAEYKQ